ncbi:MAG: histidine kinase [Chloracidobacterium sp.]
MHNSATRFHIFPHTKKQWLGTVAAIFIIAAVAKLAIFSVQLFFGVDTSQFPLWQGYLISLEYTSIICLTQLTTGELAHRIFPLKNKTTAILHILIQSVSASRSFVIAREIEIIILGDCVLPPQVFTAIVSVSFVLSILGNSIYYLMLFYRRAKAAEQAALQAELKALRAQINPHFLFNVLNSIWALVDENPVAIRSLVTRLSKFLRYSLATSNATFVTLDEEVEAIRNYLEIQRTRFEQNLEWEIEVKPATGSLTIPPFLLQPLVENAIKFGMRTSQMPLRIRVSARMRGDTLVIRVMNSGAWVTPRSGVGEEGTGIGLANIRQRIGELFAENATLRAYHRRGWVSFRLCLRFRRVS